MVLGKNNTVYIWGGRSDSDTGYSGGQNYLEEMRILSFQTGNATQNTLNMAWRILNTLPNNIYPRIDSAATLSGDGTKIFYTGGLAAQPSATNQSSYTLTAVDMSNILTYDTTTGNWETLQTSGPTPAKRVIHTATLSKPKQFFLAKYIIPTSINRGEHDQNCHLWWMRYQYTHAC